MCRSQTPAPGAAPAGAMKPEAVSEGEPGPAGAPRGRGGEGRPRGDLLDRTPEQVPKAPSGAGGEPGALPNRRRVSRCPVPGMREGRKG